MPEAKICGRTVQERTKPRQRKLLIRDFGKATIVIPTKNNAAIRKSLNLLVPIGNLNHAANGSELRGDMNGKFAGFPAEFFEAGN